MSVLFRHDDVQLAGQNAKCHRRPLHDLAVHLDARMRAAFRRELRGPEIGDARIADVLSGEELRQKRRDVSALHVVDHAHVQQAVEGIRAGRDVHSAADVRAVARHEDEHILFHAPLGPGDLCFAKVKVQDAVHEPAQIGDAAVFVFVLVFPRQSRSPRR